MSEQGVPKTTEDESSSEEDQNDQIKIEDQVAPIVQDEQTTTEEVTLLKDQTVPSVGMHIETVLPYFSLLILS